jgi:hypothetical protein
MTVFVTERIELEKEISFINIYFALIVITP